MKYMFVLFALLLSGCGGNDANILSNTGKKIPAYFTITDKKTMDEFIFDTKKFSFKFPASKLSDFSQIGKWHGVSIRDGHTISFGLDMYYSISISTDYTVRKYGERERAIVNNDITSLRTRMPKKVTKRGEIYNITLKTIKLGKEDYSCIVRESSYPKYDKRKISYGCHKLNSSHTKVRDVAITLTYNKPNNPALAKEYTYQDLKRRAKRMLDSLYIKDGW